MLTEITDRFPTDSQTVRLIGLQDTRAATRAFAQLRKGMPRGNVVVAHWTKPQSGGARSFPIQDVGALIFVMAGIRAGSCTNLQFFDEPPNRIPRGGTSYRDLFLP